MINSILNSLCQVWTTILVRSKFSTGQQQKIISSQIIPHRVFFFFFLVASFWLNFSLFGHLFIISLCFLDLSWRHIAGHKINMHVHFKVNFDNHIPFHLFRFLKNAVASCIVPPGLEFDKCVLMVGKHTANK